MQAARSEASPVTSWQPQQSVYGTDYSLRDYGLYSAYGTGGTCHRSMGNDVAPSLQLPVCACVWLQHMNRRIGEAYAEVLERLQM